VSRAEPRALLTITAAAIVLLLSFAARAEAPVETDPISDDEDKMPPPGYLPGHREREGIGLSPHVPGQQSALPGGLTPSFGAPVRPLEGSKLDFHGYVQAGGRAGLGTRKDPTSDQASSTWHGDPVVPRGNVFENTNTIPYTWAELRFSYAQPQVTATVSIGAWALSESMQAAGSFMPNAQYWIRDAFMTYVPKGFGKVKLSWTVGVFEDRYGAMAEYGNGAYGTPLVASLPGVGDNLFVSVPLSDSLKLELERGFKTGMARAPIDIPTGPSNNWQKPWEGKRSSTTATSASTTKTPSARRCTSCTRSRATTKPIAFRSGTCAWATTGTRAAVPRRTIQSSTTPTAS